MEGGSASVGRLAIYGTAWALELPPRSPQTFPKAKRALLGFSTVRPEHVRDPPPEQCVWLLARRMLDQNRWDYDLGAAFTLVAFDTYCRASELLTLHRRHVLSPRGGNPTWPLMIGVQGERPAKNKQFDQGVIVGIHG